MKRVLTVIFQDGATLADRQLAIAYVNGTIVGGVLGLPGNEGIYNINIPGDGSDTAATNAISRIQALPQVKAAMARPQAKAGYLKPVDGASWRSWSLSPDSLGVEQNWAIEAINAPFAWGCSTGDASTSVAVIDHAFNAGEIASNTTFGSSAFGAYPGNFPHGSYVAAILAARGNDALGMSGVMWKAGLRIREIGKHLGWDEIQRSYSPEHASRWCMRRPAIVSVGTSWATACSHHTQVVAPRARATKTSTCCPRSTSDAASNRRAVAMRCRSASNALA
jgi:hypothetical protein